METEKIYNQDEVKHCFEMLNALRKKAYEIAPLCTNINSREEITGIWADGDTVELAVWSSDWGADGYEFPLEYFSMTIDEIKRTEQKKKELEEIERIKEAKRQKKAEEAAERREYERLKKKFG